MTHARQQIRDAVVIALTGLTTTGSHVFRSHSHTIGDDQLPALTIKTGNEASELAAHSSNGIRLRRILTLEISAYVKAVAGYDNHIDTIMAEIETALASNAAFNELVKLFYPQNLSIDYVGAEKVIAIATQSFHLEYQILQNDPQTII